MKAFNKKRKPKHAKKIKVLNYDKFIEDMFKLNSSIKNFCNKLNTSKEIKITIDVKGAN